jgi:hypothetical protein
MLTAKLNWDVQGEYFNSACSLSHMPESSDYRELIFPTSLDLKLLHG